MPTSLDTNLFTLTGSMASHRGAVHALSVTDEGRYLASGGSDGVKIWNMTSFKEVPIAATWRGAATALLWLRRPDRAEEILIYGTSTGFIGGWRQEVVDSTNFTEIVKGYMAKHSKVTSLAFNPANDNIAAANYRGVVQIYHLNDTYNLDNIFMSNLGKIIPKHVAFWSELPWQTKDIIVFNAESEHMFEPSLHEMIRTHQSRDRYILRHTDGKIIGQHQLGCKAIHTQTHDSESLAVIQEPAQGLALYDLRDFSRIDLFVAKITKDDNKTCPVAISEDGRLIASGTDRGVVYIFERWSGNCLDTMKTHSEDRWIEAVCFTSDRFGVVMLVSHCQDGGNLNPIQVWRLKADVHRAIGLRQMWPRLLVHFVFFGLLFLSSWSVIQIHFV
ncbi:hypothetical protein VKT23_004616 [Stygiomarasmius scandens]|uniref:WD40 repeat-like protein n=1 Tax=Marasmiellus scandens TaxID=2682957 RepID=A0ABR1JW58_9AGAR